MKQSPADGRFTQPATTEQREALARVAELSKELERFRVFNRDRDEDIAFLLAVMRGRPGERFSKIEVIRRLAVLEARSAEYLAGRIATDGFGERRPVSGGDNSAGL